MASSPPDTPTPSEAAPGTEPVDVTTPAQPEDRAERASTFLDTLLEGVEEPVLTHEIVDFLLIHDEHWLQLVRRVVRGDIDTSLITDFQGGDSSAELEVKGDESGGAPAPVPGPKVPAAGDPWAWSTTHTEAMSTRRHASRGPEDEAGARAGWQAMHLLSCDEPAAHLAEYKAQALTEALLQVYLPTSRGSFHHVGVILQFLQRSQPTAVAAGVEAHAHWLVPAMLQFFHEAPVPDTFTQLVTQKHTMTAHGGAGAGATSGMSAMGGAAAMYTPPGAAQAVPHSYSSPAQATVSFAKAQDVLQALTEQGVLDGLARLVTDPSYSPAHGDAAGHAFVAIVDYLRRYPVVSCVFVHAFAFASGSAPPAPEAVAAALEGTVPPEGAAALPPALHPGTGFLSTLTAGATAVTAGGEGDDSVAGNFDGLLDLAGTIPRRATVALRTLRTLLAFTFQPRSLPPPDQPGTEGMAAQIPGAPTDNCLRSKGGAAVVTAALPGLVHRLAGAMVAAHTRLSPVSLEPVKKKRGRKGGKGAAAGASPSPAPTPPALPLDMPMTHPGHSVRVPLGTFRLYAAQTLAELASLPADALPEGVPGPHPSDVTLAALAECPKAMGALIAWVSEYPHSSMLQAAFLRLMTAAAKRDAAPLLRVAFSSYKLLTVMMKTFTSSLAAPSPAPAAAAAPTAVAAASPPPPGVKVGGGKDIWEEGEVAEAPPSPTKPSEGGAGTTGQGKSPVVGPAPTPTIGPIVASALATDRHAASLNGTALHLLNVVRLVSDSQGPGAFLPGYVRDHAKWDGFLPLLQAATSQQLQPFARVKKNRGPDMATLGHLLGGNNSDLLALLSRLGVETPKEEEEEVQEVSLDLGSEYAKSLGLGDLAPHAGEADSPTAAGASPAEEEGGKGGKKRRRRRKRSNSGSSSSSGDGSGLDLDGMD